MAKLSDQARLDASAKLLSAVSAVVVEHTSTMHPEDASVVLAVAAATLHADAIARGYMHAAHSLAGIQLARALPSADRVARAIVETTPWDRVAKTVLSALRKEVEEQC